jgi:hypothetical protein
MSRSAVTPSVYSRAAPCSALLISSSVEARPRRFQQPRGLGRPVAERHQRVVGLAGSVAGGARGPRPRGGERRRGEAVAHLDDQPLGGLAAHAGHAGERRDILTLHTLRKGRNADAREQRQRDLRAHARHLDEAAEQPPLLLGGKGVEHVRILAHHQVGEQAHLGADRRQLQEGRHGCLELVAEPADVNRELRRRLRGDPPAHRADHLSACLRRAPAPLRASSPSRRACA